jgi:hypothetical protein
MGLWTPDGESFMLQAECVVISTAVHVPLSTKLIAVSYPGT